MVKKFKAHQACVSQSKSLEVPVRKKPCYFGAEESLERKRASISEKIGARGRKEGASWGETF